VTCLTSRADGADVEALLLAALYVRFLETPSVAKTVENPRSRLPRKLQGNDPNVFSSRDVEAVLLAGIILIYAYAYHDY